MGKKIYKGDNLSEHFRKSKTILCFTQRLPIYKSILLKQQQQQQKTLKRNIQNNVWQISGHHGPTELMYKINWHSDQLDGELKVRKRKGRCHCPLA